MTKHRLKAGLGIFLAFAALFVFLWAPRHSQTERMDAYADTLFSEGAALYEARYSYTDKDGRERVITVTVPLAGSAGSPREQVREELLRAAKGLGVELPEHFMDDVQILM